MRLAKRGGVDNTSPQCRILLVEDDPMVSRSVDRLLRARTYDLMRVASVRAARQALDRHMFRVVISDARFSDGSVADVVDAVGDGPEAVLLLADDGDPAPPARGARVHAVSKRTTAERLIDAVRAACGCDRCLGAVIASAADLALAVAAR